MANEYKENYQQTLTARRRSMGAGNRKKTENPKPKSWLYPWAWERRYSKMLVKEVVKPQVNLVMPKLRENLNRWNREVNADSFIRTDSFNDEFNQLLNELKAEANNIFGSPMEATAIYIAILAAGDGIFQFNNSQWKKQTEQVLGFEFTTDDDFWEETRKQWASENFGHLEGYSEDYRRRIREIVSRGVRQGKSTRDIMNEIRGLNTKFQNRAEFLARDQVGKLNGIITKRRMQEVGINAYIWVTAGDERVRPTHAAMNNKIMNWNNDNVYTDESFIQRNSEGKITAMNWQPRTGEMKSGVIPGEDYQCRCTAIPFWEPVLQEIDERIVV